MQCAAPMVSFMSVHTSGAVIVSLIFINKKHIRADASVVSSGIVLLT